jgi:hypothetical protein
MTRGRLLAYYAGTAAVAALLGFILGWYQAYPAQHSRDRAMLRLRLSEARSRTLDARVALARSNYGDARAHLDEAVRLLDAFKANDQAHLPPTESGKVDQAVALLREASGGVAAAGSSPETAGRTERATHLLGEVYRATPEP